MIVNVYGENYNLKFKKAKYQNNDNTAVVVITEENEPFCNLTVNLDRLDNEDLAYIDVNNCPKSIIEKLEENGDIINMFSFFQSGFVIYPLYHIGNLISKIEEV